MMSESFFFSVNFYSKGFTLKERGRNNTLETNIVASLPVAPSLLLKFQLIKYPPRHFTALIIIQIDRGAGINLHASR
jgi:hypothetical protein